MNTNGFMVKSAPPKHKYIVRTCFVSAMPQSCCFPSLEQAQRKFLDIVQGAIYNVVISKVQLIVDSGKTTYEEVLVMELRKGGI